jgi:hypothetical protein
MAAPAQEVTFELDWPLKFATTTFVCGAVLGFLGGFRVCSCAKIRGSLDRFEHPEDTAILFHKVRHPRS